MLKVVECLLVLSCLVPRISIPTSSPYLLHILRFPSSAKIYGGLGMDMDSGKVAFAFLATNNLTFTETFPSSLPLSQHQPSADIRLS